MKPTQLPTIDTESVRAICQKYIDYIGGDNYHEDNDYAHFIFETTMEAVYGEDIWDYINKESDRYPPL